MADEKKAPEGVALTHADKGASVTVAGVLYAIEKKTGQVLVAAEHVAEALCHGFFAPKAEEKAK